jgi:hypothetical protein
MTRTQVETAARMALVPEEDETLPIEARGSCFRGLVFALAIEAAVFGGIGLAWWWLA